MHEPQETRKDKKMDLKNLPKSLKDGVRLKNDENRVVIVTPLGRVNFPALKNPKTPKQRGGEPARPYFGVVLIWNWKHPDKDAHINLDAVLNPAIKEVAERAGLNPRGWLRRGDDEKLIGEDGQWKPGYGPGMVFASINTGAMNKDGTQRPAPTVRDPDKREIDAGLVKSGYYGRAVCDIYANNYGKICFGLQEFQLIAKGELLYVPRQTDYSGQLDDVGGDSFEGEVPSQLPQDDGDDIPF